MHMTDYKETVTTSRDAGIDATGTAVEQRTRRVNTRVAGDGTLTVANIIWYILGIVEVLLAFRFVMKLLGANPNSGFVDFIYSVTSVLTAPFDNIFGVATARAGTVRSVF